MSCPWRGRREQPPAACPDCGADVLARADIEGPDTPGRPPFNALRIPEDETMTLHFIVARILRELIELAECDDDAELGRRRLGTFRRSRTAGGGGPGPRSLPERMPENVAGACSVAAAGCSRSRWTMAAGSARRQRPRWTWRCGSGSCSGRRSTRCSTSVPTIATTSTSARRRATVAAPGRMRRPGWMHPACDRLSGPSGRSASGLGPLKGTNQIRG